MRNAILRCFGLAMAVAIGALGCSEDPGAGQSNGKPTPSSTNQKPPPPAHAPDFLSGQGQAEKGSTAYPAGPYGIAKNSIIANYDFVGFANAKVVNNAMQAIQLADFYNPHADDPAYQPADPSQDDRLFPKGSAYGEGTPKPKVLLIDVASVWCGPCNEEAKSTLPPLHKKYKPCGGEFLLQLADGPAQNTPADPKNLFNWTTKYKVDFPATIDPNYKLGALFSQDAFPANMIIDTRTMTIVEVIAGAPPIGGAFWQKFEKVLNDPTCLAAQP